jgi:hypothetical protein
MKAKMISVIVAVGLLATNTFSYGPTGHSMVGAIADRRLAKTNASIAAKVSQILDGLSLADAALLPDEIKGWDAIGKATTLARLKSHPTIQSQLAAYWKANRALEDGQQLHRIYHFTDVPVLDKEKYADGEKGRFEHDIVHMIPFCISVLKGDVKENNPRKITKAVAIILLAHFFGDIHQPLHVGAEFFNAKGKPTNPDKGGQFFGDEGGNNLNLSLRKAGRPRTLVPTGKVLHGYWDNNAALTALGLMQAQFKSAHPTHPLPATQAELAEEFASLEPAVWKLPPQLEVKDWAEALANDILPLAAEAHQRLRFTAIKIIIKHNKKEAAGKAEEQNAPDGFSYQNWAGKVVVNELHKAGWRLAALLEQIVH